MTSENFRYYCLNPNGRLEGAEWFSAANDQDAIARIEVERSEALCEIWQGKRLVAKLSPARLRA